MADLIENKLNDIYIGTVEVKNQLDNGIIISPCYIIDLYDYIHIKIIYRYNKTLTFDRNIDYICNEIDKCLIKNFKY